MSLEKYSKHQKSRHPRYVYTTPDGTVYKGNDDEELRKEMITDGVIIPKSVRTRKNVSTSKPKFDPNTGERIN